MSTVTCIIIGIDIDQFGLKVANLSNSEFHIQITVFKVDNLAAF